jgi:LytS/YehU family sensor histidine kinase
LIVHLARKFPITGPRAGRNAFLHVGFAVATHFALTYLLLFVREAAYPNNPLFARLVEGILWDVGVYITVVALAHASWLHQDSRLREAQYLRLAAQLAQSRFEALTLQLQPHFLFNSLNAISELVYRDPKLADYALTRLAELLRMALASSGQVEGTIEEEMRFLEAYAEIERLRAGGGLDLEWDIPAYARHLAVPVLILQPLVENAFRHGIRGGAGSRVDVRARVLNGTLRITIADDGRGLGQGPIHEGLGLRNTRERLESLYGTEGQLTLSPRALGGALVEIVLPARALTGELVPALAPAEASEPKARVLTAREMA